MRATAIEAALAAANPVPCGELFSAGLDDAGAHMLAAICAEPATAAMTPGAQRRQNTRAASKGKVLRTRWLTASATAAVVVAVLVFAVAGGGGTGSGTPAFGAALVHYADNSPLVMRQLPVGIPSTPSRTVRKKVSCTTSPKALPSRTTQAKPNSTGASAR